MTQTALGVYIFAGGFTLGVKEAGFEILAQFEDGAYGVETTRKNHPGLDVFDDQKSWPSERYEGKIGFLYGNPPCAPFSNAGISSLKKGKMHDHWKRDERTNCILRMFEVLEIARPTVWAWESVQLAFKRGRPMIDELTERAAAMGYSASYVLMNAVHLGVPQIRRRFFCVFHKVAIDWEYPIPPPEPMTVGDAWKAIAVPC